MNFKKRRIRQQLKKFQQIKLQTPAPQGGAAPAAGRRGNPQLISLATIIAGLVLVGGLFWITVSIISSLDFGSLVFSFGKELKKDSHRHTNFLLAGVGGAEHDGSNLTDTLILASLDEQGKTVRMLSLPRDLYIDDKITGGQRINKVYDTYLNKYGTSREAMERLGLTITELTGIPVHYTVKVNFNGFVQIVDALGGVDVEVEESIYDPYYPKGETIYYETFSLAAGPQHLDGETALKFARSRKTTSDFDRAKRQQQLLAAIKDKAFSLNILSDPGKIQSLYNSLADSIETDLSVAEIIQLAKISQDIDRGQIDSQVFTDDFTSCGGLLYTPVREYFGGAAVLLPAGDGYQETRRFSDNYFNANPDRLAPIQVLNGTKVSGLALDYLNRLSRDCLNVVYYGNASDRALEKSVIRYLPAATPAEQQQLDQTLEIIRQTIDAPLVDSIPAEYLEDDKRIGTKIVIELGADYRALTSADPFNQLRYTTPVATPETEKAADSTTTEEPEKPLNSENPISTDPAAAPSASTPAASTTAPTGVEPTAPTSTAAPSNSVN